MNIAVIGGVISTTVLIEKLNEYKFKNVKVWAFKPNNLLNVSGWEDLSLVAKQYDYQFINFSKVALCENSLKQFEPDYIFVVGLSQIIPESIINIPKYGCIGFHPTLLPYGRGRAPIAWLVLEEKNGGATFFFLESGVDSGPIIEQVEFKVTNKDDAGSTTSKMLEAQKKALDSLLPKIKDYKIQSYKQDVELATWFGKRNPEDGLLNWNQDANQINKLVRASTYPHPGAFTFYKHVIINIWEVEQDYTPIKGVIGRIVFLDDEKSSFLVQTGKGLIKVKKWSSKDWIPKIGKSLGYISQIEINKILNENIELRLTLQNLQEKISYMEKLIKRYKLQ